MNQRMLYIVRYNDTFIYEVQITDSLERLTKGYSYLIALPYSLLDVYSIVVLVSQYTHWILVGLPGYLEEFNTCYGPVDHNTEHFRKLIGALFNE